MSNLVYRPSKLSLESSSDIKLIEKLKNASNVTVIDTIQHQIKELIQIENPAITNQDAISKLIEKKKQGVDIDKYGNWFYFPWNHEVIHLLPKNEFVKVRTNRNNPKITTDEQHALSNKTIGVVGLSVGQSVSIALSIERISGHLLIADFDTLDLSNLNRIRTSVRNLGLPKTIVTAREIAEIDPYLSISVYEDGITEENIDEFVSNTDLIIEECDSIDIKILIRKIAKKHKKPVLMDTSDRGMIDIERMM